MELYRCALKDEGRVSGRQPCCLRDGGRPSGIALQGEIPNRRKLLGSKALVVSVTGKGEARPRQVRVPELNTPQPLWTCRNSLDVTKPRGAILSWDESGERLLIGPTVTGI